MSNTHEDRMLNALLREVAQEDARLDGAELEERVMAAWDDRQRWSAARPATGHRTVWVCGGIAAAIVIAVAVPHTPVADRAPRADLAPQADLSAVARPNTPRFGETSPRPVSPELAATEQATVDRSARSANGGRKPALRSVRRPQPTYAESSTITFVPLGPMAAEDLSGSFQIVQVQIPRFSLGALAPTLDLSQTSDLIETDVLLGADGMARAIRVSSNESNYPWRSR